MPAAFSGAADVLPFVQKPDRRPPMDMDSEAPEIKYEETMFRGKL